MAKNGQDDNPSDLRRFLSGRGAGQSRLRLLPGQVISAQGDPPDALFYIESGWVKCSVVSPNGKEVIALRGDGEFLDLPSLVDRRSLATATTLTECSLIRIVAAAVMSMLREEAGFAEMLVTSVVHQYVRSQETVLGQVNNSREKRLARLLLQLANLTCPGNPRPVPPPINQAVLANMICTTRSRVSFFMNKFRQQGFIEYDRQGHISVRDSLLSVISEP